MSMVCRFTFDRNLAGLRQDDKWAIVQVPPGMPWLRVCGASLDSVGGTARKSFLVAELGGIEVYRDTIDRVSGTFTQFGRFFSWGTAHPYIEPLPFITATTLSGVPYAHVIFEGPLVCDTLYIVANSLYQTHFLHVQAGTRQFSPQGQDLFWQVAA